MFVQSGRRTRATCSHALLHTHPPPPSSSFSHRRRAAAWSQIACHRQQALLLRHVFQRTWRVRSPHRLPSSLVILMHISVTFVSANLVSAIRFPAISSSSPPCCSSSYTKCPFAAQFHRHPPRGVVQLRPDHSRVQSADGMMRVLLLRSLVHPLHGLCLRPHRSHGDVCVMRIPNAAINSFRIPRSYIYVAPPTAQTGGSAIIT